MPGLSAHSVVFVSDVKDGRSRYYEAVSDCCDRGGLELELVPSEGNEEIVCRFCTEDGRVIEEVKGWQSFSHAYPRHRKSHPAFGRVPNLLPQTSRELAFA